MGSQQSKIKDVRKDELSDQVAEAAQYATGAGFKDKVFNVFLIRRYVF